MPKKSSKKVLKKPLEKPSTLSNQSNNIINLFKSPKWNPKLQQILKILTYVKINRSDYIDIIEKHINSTDSDSKIFKDLLKLKFTPENMYSEKSDTNRAFKKWHNIKYNIPKNISSILDYGGNIGMTASVLGRKILKLPKNKTLVVDVEEWSGNKWIPRDDITFYSVENMKKIPSGSVDLITCFHTLHHIPKKEYDYILSNFYRILSTSGCLVLFEHNCTNKEWAGLIDLEHAIYDVVVSKKISYVNFVENEHYAKYLSINNWLKLFQKYGFKQHMIKELKNKDNSFYLYLTKK